MRPLTSIADKAGLLGSIVAAMGCASCFPALASLGAAVGLGFLSRWEGLFITTLIPLFAALALIANVLSWLNHRQMQRLVPGLVGPLLVLAAALLMRFYGVSTAALLYVGLALMLGVSVWDVVSPAHRRCAPEGCEPPPRHG